MKKILITKDALRKDHLPCYGNKYWNTPNIDELAVKGTIFNKHYTAGTSTAMSITSMFAGKNSFEVKRKKYEEVDEYKEGETLFDEFHKKGYKTFVIWPFEWKELAWKYSKVFPKETTVILLKNISQNIIRNVQRKIVKDDNKALSTINLILNKIAYIINNNEHFFLWVHLPHVINGRTSYGSDIDLLDSFVGEIRKSFDDNSIYISADHGHMNGDKGIPVYGFHAYQGTISIFLISPRIGNNKTIDFPTSNTQLKDIILNNKIEKLNYVYSDTQYYLQENRKLAIINDKYKYIFNKKDNTEELYDLDFDPSENVNLLINKWYDRNRLGYYNLNEIYYYPYWDKVENVYLELRAEKDRIWKVGSFLEETAYKLNNFRKKSMKNITNSKKTTKGKFGAVINNRYYEA
ncbi:MAG: sulfatase-like hydrolase/transferase [Candidatus Tenebribacter burtonii]|nr:sulfatase-like hydrolase/transferase [Candidatus Tenebribacter burtonii]